MPIAPGTALPALTALIQGSVAAYNAPGTATAAYNMTYAAYIATRQAGIAAKGGSLSAWLAGGGSASSVYNLLDSFGMNKQGSKLMPVASLHAFLTGLNPLTVDWISNFCIPLHAAPCAIGSPHVAGSTLAAELLDLYDRCASPGVVTASGGFVAGSKTMHCLFPEIAPMIDGRHSGLSYYHIDRASYLPPLGLASWTHWVGHPVSGVPNPSPRGGGRHSWRSEQFLGAIGVGQTVYEHWIAAHPALGHAGFMALDPAPGTIGIPRIIDKVLW